MKKYLLRMYCGTLNAFLKEISADLCGGRKRFIITANAEIVMKAEKVQHLHEMLLDPEVVLAPDGISVVKACRKAGVPVSERITGIDIASFLIEEGYKEQKTFFLLGSRPEVIESLVKKLEQLYPGIRIAGYSHGYVADKDSVFESIVELQPDICMVALGVPAQEELIYRHIGKFAKGIFVGVGGSFDVLSGATKRAPSFFIRLNLEWLYRIAGDRARMKRFWDNNIKFMWRLRR